MPISMTSPPAVQSVKVIKYLAAPVAYTSNVEGDVVGATCTFGALKVGDIIKVTMSGIAAADASTGTWYVRAKNTNSAQTMECIVVQTQYAGATVYFHVTTSTTLTSWGFRSANSAADNPTANPTSISVDDVTAGGLIVKIRAASGVNTKAVTLTTCIWELVSG